MRPTPRDVRRWARCGAELLTPLLLGALLPACATLTVGEERQLGAQIAGEMRGELRFIEDPVVVGYVGAIGDEIVRAAGPQRFEYRFMVVEDDEINAFAAPGGYVYVHTGTILRARNASELAAVLAHEIGHVVRRHHAKSYGRSRGVGTLHEAAVLAASLFGYGGLASVGGGLAAVTVLNSFTRSEEREADAFAIEMLPAAGYDPSGLVTFLDVVREATGPVASTFLSSHPGAEERIAEATALVAAQPRRPGLRVTDRGRLEIIQRRIELLTGKVRPTDRTPL
jgi:predicted Zn-dependent protease